jgi:hypothetical protein
LQRLHHQPTNPTIAQIYISSNQKLAESIRPSLPIEPQARSRFRPMSPVKALSSFLGGISKEQTSPAKPPNPTRLDSHEIKFPPPSYAFNQPAIQDSKITSGIKTTQYSGEGSFDLLENTLNTYIVALHSRCGNVVGKIIRNRSNANELTVNELYNALLEDPSQYQTTAEVPVDVLFSAFEKFLNVAWREKMGPLMPQPILTRMHEIFNTRPQNQIQEPFKSLLAELSPQNQRAFSALVKLLFDLLESSGNDGDRGAITATFAEVMFPDTDPRDYIAFLDRLIESIEVLFDDVVLSEGRLGLQPSLQRSRSTNTGSLSSATSSLKKKFGFGTLSRENSKSEPESRVGQMLRNLSKKAAGDGNNQPSSLSKSFLTRSRSTDNDNRRPLLSRPGSSSKENQPSPMSTPQPRPVTTHRDSPDIASQMEALTVGRNNAPRRKRRSSLSDLSNLQSSSPLDFASSKPRKIEMPADSITPFQLARRNLQASPLMNKQRSPQPEIPSKIPSPANRKENVPPVTTRERSPPKLYSGTESIISPRKRDLGLTQIPTFKHSSPVPTSHGSSQRKTSSPQKLRIQSPQKVITNPFQKSLY